MFKGKESTYSAEKLKAGEDGIIVGFGQSMAPVLASGQPVEVEHLTEETALKKNDIVFCKVRGHYYLHKILAVKNGRYQIGNNHGHVNGWFGRGNIYGRVVRIF